MEAGRPHECLQTHITPKKVEPRLTGVLTVRAALAPATRAAATAIFVEKNILLVIGG